LFFSFGIFYDLNLCFSEPHFFWLSVENFTDVTDGSRALISSSSLGGLGWKQCGRKILSVLGDSVRVDSPRQLRASLFLYKLLLGWMVQGLLLLRGHVDHKVHHSVVVAKFVVIPGNELDKVIIEGNVIPRIKGERVEVAVEIAGDNLVLSVDQDAFWGGLLMPDVIIFGCFLQAASQIHH
jgi:hypothetical protein